MDAQGDFAREVSAAAAASGPTPLAEQLPYRRFLGLGAWWAWIWLCYMTTVVVGGFPEEYQLGSILAMYLVSTLSIAAVMVTACVAWRPFTRLIDNDRAVGLAAVIAGAATFVLGHSGGGNALFLVAAVFTGLGTGALCLKVGRVYGTVGLADSLTAGALSLVFAALLFFVGVGLPSNLGLVFAALLPVASAFLLAMPSDDPYGPLFSEQPQPVSLGREGRQLWIRLMAAAAIVAFTAGVGKGVSSLTMDAAAFGRAGTITVLVVGAIGVIITAVMNRWAAERRGARIVYNGLMVLGVAMMLACGFGFPIGYLNIGKETLWLVFSCLMAYMAFRFGLPNVRAFAMGQAVYFLGSTAGWAAGAAIAPFYGEGTVAMAVGVIMAFAVVIVMTYIFTADDIRDIRIVPCPGLRPVTAATFGGAPGLASGAAGGLAEVAPGPIGAPGTSGAPEAPDIEAAASTQDRVLGERYGLSGREIEIMRLFAQGRSANWIADALVISKNTVRSHLRAIYTKLDVHTRQELLDLLASL